MWSDGGYLGEEQTIDFFFDEEREKTPGPKIPKADYSICENSSLDKKLLLVEEDLILKRGYAYEVYQAVNGVG